MDRRKFLQNTSSAAALLTMGRFVQGCSSSSSATPPINPIPPAGPVRAYDYQLSYVAAYGQSLSMGGKASPILSATQRFDSVMFNGGVIAQAYSSDLTHDYGTLVPLVENASLTDFNSQLLGVFYPGETPVAGTLEAIKELMQSQDNLGPTDIKYQLLGSAPGHGEYTLAQLSKGTIPYQRVIYEVTQAVALAKQMGITFGVPAMSWAQGEYDIGTAPATYQTELIALFTDLNTDILALTGQTKDMQFLSYQTAQNGCYAIAATQYQVAQMMDNVHIATPAYFLQTDGAPWFDGIHLDNVSSKTMGAYFGSAYKRIVVNGEAWLPLSPKAISVSGNVITINLNVYDGAAVVADTQHITTTCPIKPSLGFTLLNASGKAQDIDNQVKVTGNAQITITSPVPVTTGFALHYGDEIDGFSGGNIRDNYGDTYVFNGGGLDIAMHNWLTVFGYTFP